VWVPAERAMDRGTYRLRPFEEQDYPAFVRLFAEVNPENAVTVEEVRHWEKAFRAPHLVDEKWTVVERRTNEPVAFCEMSHSAFSYHPQKLWATANVTRSHQGKGIGRDLALLLESEAAAHRVTHFWTSVRSDDPRALEFARKQGFVEQRRLWLSTLDVEKASVPPPSESAARLLREGVTFTTLAEEGVHDAEVRRRLFSLLEEASRDVPRMGEYTPITYEQFVAELDGPGLVADGYFLARYGEAYVGSSNLERDLAHPDSLRVGFTGTRASYRGRGVATELKRRTIEYARTHAVRYLRTVNDSLNRPMWGINEKAGFRRTVEWVNLERRFPSSGPDAPAPGPGPST